jgi:hypothetical protein
VIYHHVAGTRNKRSLLFFAIIKWAQTHPPTHQGLSD